MSLEEDGVDPKLLRQEVIFTCTPQPIISLLGVKIKQFSLGRDHCLAVTSDGEVYAWGDNSKNQLGLKFDDDELNKPVSSSSLFKPQLLPKSPNANEGKGANDSASDTASLSSGNSGAEKKNQENNAEGGAADSKDNAAAEDDSETFR